MAAGYQEGARIGLSRFGTYFDGTSIIIPSYNQVDFLKKCLTSIHKHTNVAYEIIVVDNASSDGTAAYLQSVDGVVRYRVLERNCGFAGAVNVGMMMAKGTSLLLLNNDTIVTDNWLSNLLACLNSDPGIGMVGPVTNNISGDQRIEVPYTTEKEIASFGRRFNVHDPAKWQRTDRLKGFCLLFRRELWDRTGYLDEGFAIGNYEDDDFSIRVRLQGYSLVTARDTFIHHFGSVSMKALGERFNEVNDRNLHVYMDKWGNPHELIHEVHARGLGLAGQGETSFFPEGVVVRGVTAALYWVENGRRRPIAGTVSVPAIRLSQVDLRRWPVGEPIAAEAVEAAWLQQPQISEAGGLPYIVENGLRRRVTTAKAGEAWGLGLRQGSPFPAGQLGTLAEGLPIIAHVQVAERL